MQILDREISQVAVFGFGKTGWAVTEFLLARGVRLFVSDAGRISSEGKDFLIHNSVAYEENGHTDRALIGTDLIVVSPGVSPGIPILTQARERGITIMSEIDLASLFLTNVPLIGVTGTNGKSTTVKLIEAILTEQGHKVASAGNIGVPLISVIEEQYDAIVVEVSSFQLEQSRLFHPHVGVLLNITPDHLDRHGTLADYRAAKLRLFANQTAHDYAVLPHEFAAVSAEIASTPVYYERVELPPSPEIDQLHPHNRANLQAAIAAAQCVAPFDPEEIPVSALAKAFSLPFRMQVEGRVNGALVINDSKSTNAASTIAALRSITSPVVLILGGRHKLAGYDMLAHEITEHNVRHTFIYGEAGAFLKSKLQSAGITNFTVFPDFSSAVICAMDHIKSGEVLLFSPGCSSYDQFTDYIERGNAFSTRVHAHPTFRPSPDN